MRVKYALLIAAGLLFPTAASADFDPHDPNYSVCVHIVQNCSVVGYGGYSSFQECWMDQGDPWCPEQQPDPYGQHDYSGNPWWMETYWRW